MNPNAFPVQLRQRAQWVCWASRERDGKQTKIPIDPATGAFASTADSGTWGTFDDVLARATQPDISGVGFVFTSTDSFVGIDLDDCREPETGELTDEAIEIVMRLHSYTEVSPSGTGLHIIVRGELPAGKRRHDAVEMYEDGRFFTMTGNRVSDTPERVCERPASLRGVHRSYVAHPTPSASESEPSESTSASVDATADRQLTFATKLDDEELFERAKTATNGEKFTRLWNGDVSGYDSHSEADMALCCLLAFWTGRDPNRMDELFRQSGLMRQKWNEVHYSDGATYGERTLERACEQVTESFGEGEL